MILKTMVTFDAAHRLTFHNGKCKNLHGHTWKVEVQIDIGTGVDTSDDMILDFGAVKEFIRTTFDHKLLIFQQDPDLNNSVGLKGEHTLFPFETTAENIAGFIRSEIWGMVSAEDTDVKVTVWETPDNCVVAD
jgi:6-pyruvoyltetrahydropterin/6-carboxytetrahydropterin synthase